MNKTFRNIKGVMNILVGLETLLGGATGRINIANKKTGVKLTLNFTELVNFSPFSFCRTCCSGRVKSILIAASCWELSEH